MVLGLPRASQYPLLLPRPKHRAAILRGGELLALMKISIRYWMISGFLVAGIVVGVCVLSLMYIQNNKSNASVSGLDSYSQSRLMLECEGKVLKSATAVTTQDVNLLVSVSKYCFSDTARQAMLIDYSINRTLFSTQNSQTNVLLWLVVAITVSGVILSAIQLIGAYKLASASSKDIGSQGGSLDIEGGRISLRSSVTGLLILAISFAFFIVFVKSVYSLNGRFLDPAIQTASQVEDELSSSPTPEAQVGEHMTGAPAGRQLASGGLGFPPSANTHQLASGGLGSPLSAIAKSASHMPNGPIQPMHVAAAPVLSNANSCVNEPRGKHP
jgi:hypothetical protein